MKLIRLRSIRSRLLAGIIISTLFVFGPLSFFTIMKSREQIRSSMDTKIVTISALLQKISIPFYENFDYGPLGEFAQEAGKDPEIEFVVFLDDKNAPLAKAGDDKIEISQDLISEKKIQGKDGTLHGIIRIGFNDKLLQKNMKRELATMAIGSIIAIILFTIVVSFLSGKIVKPIRQTVCVLKKIASGDLTVNIEVRAYDETGQVLEAIKNMLESLKKIISGTSDLALKVNSFAVEISGTVNDQAAISAQQSASVAEISSTMEEFSATSAQIAENSNSVAEIAGNTLGSMQEGVRSVEIFMEKMNKINDDNQNNIREITELRKKADEITKVMGIINNIADQTKLIAFNAALEASSAGEAGKRFSVVAAEIRRLADNVMESTLEIESRINEIQSAANHMVIASETSTKGVQEGLESFSRTVGMLNDTLTGARSTTDAAKQISLSTQQQKTATDQVVVALRDIAQGSRQTSDSISNISSVSKELAEISADLQELMKKFILNDQDLPRNTRN